MAMIHNQNKHEVNEKISSENPFVWHEQIIRWCRVTVLGSYGWKDSLRVQTRPAKLTIYMRRISLEAISIFNVVLKTKDYVFKS